MGHWLLNALTVLALLLCIAAAVMWVRSYGGSDYVRRARRVALPPGDRFSDDAWEVQWTRGQVRLQRWRNLLEYPGAVSEPDRKPTWQVGRLGVGHVEWEAPPGGWLGFRTWARETMTSFSWDARRVWAVPAWAIVAALALVPAATLAVRWSARRRRRAGRCGACGYDLTANVSGVCPECGAAIPKPAAK